MMRVEDRPARRPFTLVVSGEARRHGGVVQQLLGPSQVDLYDAMDIADLMAAVQAGRADAVVVDSDGGEQELLKTLRMIRRVNPALPVVLVARRVSRRFMENALRLEAFCVVHKPLEREELLIQLRRLVERFSGSGRT